jgi:hypothetical protein
MKTTLHSHGLNSQDSNKLRKLHFQTNSISHKRVFSKLHKLVFSPLSSTTHKAHSTKRTFHYDFEEFNDCAYIYLILAKSLGHLFLLQLINNHDIPVTWIIDLRDEFFAKFLRNPHSTSLIYSLLRYAPYSGLS